MNLPSITTCLCLAAASLPAQGYLELPATASPASELPSYTLLPLMQPNARVQMFFDATEVGSPSFLADELALRFDGPIPQVGAPGPFSIAHLVIRVGVTTVPMPDANFAGNLTQPLTTVHDGAWTYLPDSGSAFPHPWGGPGNGLLFPFALPVPVTIPAGGWFVIDITMEGNNISSFGFAHAILDGAATTGGITDGSAVNFGQGCSTANGQPAATIGSTGIYAPGGAHFLSGQNLGANALALTLFGLVNPAGVLPGTTCTIYADPIVLSLVITDALGAFGSNQAGAVLAMPADNSAAGLVIYEQAVSLVGTANPWGLVSSNGMAVTLGSFAAPGRGTYTVAHDSNASAAFANDIKAFGYAVRLRTL